MERRAALCYLASFVLLHRFAFAQQSPGVPATPPTDASQVRAGIQFAPEGDPAFRPSRSETEIPKTGLRRPRGQPDVRQAHVGSVKTLTLPATRFTF
jgi:hypothetical protein